MEMTLSFQSKAKALKQAQRNDTIIRDLMKLPENRKCINCNSLGPQYVCTTFWTFVCLTCSGIHREFTHRVKSVSMANFTSQEVASLQAGGNKHGKKVYLGQWNSQHHSVPDGSDIQILRDFIKHAYVERRYAGDTKIIDGSSRIQKVRVVSHLRNEETLCDRSLNELSDDWSVNSSYRNEERCSGCGEEPLRNSINRRSSISYEAVNEKLLDDKQHVKKINEGLLSIEEAQIEQRLSRHPEKLNFISRQLRLRETVQPFDWDSPNVCSCEASPLQEVVFSSWSGSDTVSLTANMKEKAEVFPESKAELESHIYGSTPAPQSSPSTGETSFSNKFQAVVLRMMENKKGSVGRSKAGSEPPNPEGIQAMQTCQLIGEQTMTSSDNWALLDPPVQGKMCPSLNFVNLDSLAPASTKWGISAPSNRQQSNTSGSTPDHRHDMLHGVPSQLPKSSTANTSRKKELTESEALFAATFSSFSWSQAPSSCESGERIPHIVETQSSLLPLKSRNPFDVSNELTNFQGTMPAREEHADLSYSTRLLHSSSTLSTSSHFFPSPSSPNRLMPTKGPFYASERPSTCAYKLQGT